MNSGKMLGISVIMVLTVLVQTADAQGVGMKRNSGYSNASVFNGGNGNQAHKRVRSYRPGWNWNPPLNFGDTFRTARKSGDVGNNRTLLRWRLYGCDSLGWCTGFPTSGHVCYRAVYPGIDLIYYGSQGLPGYDFLVAPGANPCQIVLLFDGMDDCYLSGQGDLILRTAGGTVIRQPPTLYQEINGIRKPVWGHYVLRGKGRVGLEVGSYNTALPLIIARR